MMLAILQDRRVVLSVVVAGLAPAFFATRTIVAKYRGERHRLAIEWSEAGRRDLAKNPEAAVSDFESAVSFNSDSRDDRLRLAEALIGAGRAAEARAHLLTLWTEEPGNGPINLDLARLAAKDSDLQNATRYYHTAIDGAWDTGAAGARRSARLELANLLIAGGQQVRAQAELIALMDDLPADPAQMADIAARLAEAGADARALSLARRALDLDPHNARAAAVAGAVAFRSGDFARAAEYLNLARRTGALGSQEKEMLEVSESGQLLDFDAANLSDRERAKRLQAALDASGARLNRCQPPSADLSAQIDRLKKLAARAIERDTDVFRDAVRVISDVEALPTAACGGDLADDEALRAIVGRGRISP